MSYENVPKNLTEKAVLVRGGRPDYSKLEAAAFPSPTLDESGAVLENTDTGNRYRWSGTDWHRTEVGGERLVSDLDTLAQMVLNTAQLLANKASNDTKLDTIADKIINNVSGTAVLVRGSKPDFLLLSTDPFPTPTADEAGAILEHSDTGDRYRWSSTLWAMIEIDKSSTSPTLAIPFLLTLSNPTLAADTVVGSRDITLTAGHGLTSPADLGLTMELADASNGSFFIQSLITAIVGDVITLDSPLNRVYTTAGSLVAVSTAEMNVDGSVTPIIFKVLPFDLQQGNISRVLLEMRDATSMDFSTFGGLPVLDNGIVLRVNNGDGTFRHLHNFKDNGDIIEIAFDHAFLLPKGGNVINGFTSRITWGSESKHGAVIRLDGTLGQGLELIVQDDLTGLLRMRWTAQGKEL